MGLKSSEHISKIIVSPNDPNLIFVVSQGPLWSSGGEEDCLDQLMVERIGKMY